MATASNPQAGHAVRGGLLSLVGAGRDHLKAHSGGLWPIGSIVVPFCG